jgi:antitoxin VapB
MSIKDPQVRAMAKELATRRGTSVTDAARQEELQALLARYRQLHWPEGLSSKEAQDALYDDQGLPA